LRSSVARTGSSMLASTGTQYSGYQNGKKQQQSGTWQQQAAVAGLLANTLLEQNYDVQENRSRTMQSVDAAKAITRVQQIQQEFDEIILEGLWFDQTNDFWEKTMENCMSYQQKTLFEKAKDSRVQDRLFDLMDQGAELTFDTLDQFFRPNKFFASQVALERLFVRVCNIIQMQDTEKRNILLPPCLLYLHEKNLLHSKIPLSCHSTSIKERIARAYETFAQTATMISTDNYKEWYFLIKNIVDSFPTIKNLCLQQHELVLSKAKAEIENVTELTAVQKSQIIEIINKISWKKLLDQEYDLQTIKQDLSITDNMTLLAQEGKYIDISDELLLKHFPLGLWLNSIAMKVNKSYGAWASELDSVHISQFSMDQVALLKTKQKRSYSEQLFLNLVSDVSTGFFPGLYQIVPKNEDPRNDSSGYIKGGFAGELQKHKIFEQLVLLEKDFAQKGYTVFVHGRAWEWNFLNDIWNLICDVKFNECDYERISLRQRDPQNCNVEQLLQWRQELVQNGSGQHIGTGTKDVLQDTAHSEVTFVNLSALSNCGYYGECTGTYVVGNHSIAAKGAALQKANDLIAKYGLELYMPEWLVAELYKKHQKISGMGETLCIAVKNQYVDEIMYPAKSGGLINNKRYEKIPFDEIMYPARSGGFINNTRYDKIHFLRDMKLQACASEFISKIENNVRWSAKELDQQRRFYCMAVSDLPGEYGDKYVIKSVAVTDPELYAQYLAELNALFKQVKAQLAQQK
jgi:hypothetical protein